AKLEVDTGSLQLGPGAFTLSGFGKSQLTATKDISIAGDGKLAATGDLMLDGGVFQSTGAFDYAIATDAGHLVTASSTPVNATSRAAPGGSLSFKGDDVTLGGNFFLPSGLLSAESTAGSTQVAPGATINLAGRSVVFDGKSVSSAGGALTLIADAGSVAIAS